jgi:hypothetical protein
MHATKTLDAASTSVFSNATLKQILNSELSSRFGRKKKPAKNLHKVCFDALVNELDSLLARKVRLDDLSNMCANLWPSTMFGDKEIPCLNSLFEKNFLLINGCVDIKISRVEEFANLSASIDPAVVTGWGLAKRFSEKSISLDQIFFTSLSSHERMYVPLSKVSGLAENHVHLGGAYGINLSFFSAIFSKSFRGEISGEMSSLRRWLVELFNLTDPSNQKLSEKILKTEFSGAWATTIPLILDWEGLANESLAHDATDFLKIRKFIAVAWTSGDVDKAWLGMHFWLWLCYIRTSNRWVRIAIVLAVLTMMCERRKLVMQGSGLSRFVQSFHRASRKHGTPSLQDFSAARRIFSNELDVAEIKVPFHNIVDVIPQLTYAIARLQTGIHDPVKLIYSDAYEAALTRAVSRWHCCLHFFRLKEYLTNPELILSEARAIGRSLSTRPNWNLPKNLLGKDIPWTNSRIGDWIRGIDVAGDENCVRIEYFSPALRLLREVLFKQDEKGNSYSPIHLSLHAGEDFADIASGLRHIDESIQFCDMRKGDRLGHALALGISPVIWAQGKDSIILPLDEHLDNLVWIWRRTKEFKIAEFDDVLEVLADRVKELFNRLPWIFNYDVSPLAECHMDDLSQEWALRKNSYDHWMKLLSCRTTAPLEDLAIVPDKNLLDMKDSPGRNLFMMRARWVRETKVTSPSLGKVEFKYSMPMVHVQFVEANEKLRCNVVMENVSNYVIEDSYHPRQLELLKDLQDLLFSEYTAADLQIEVNPTSNVFIGDFKGYTQHPVFRWMAAQHVALENSEEENAHVRKSMGLTINTDDPGVMPTSLRLEFALVHQAALSAGFTTDETQSWILRLEEAGISEFKEKHQGVKTFSASDSAAAIVRHL